MNKHKDRKEYRKFIQDEKRKLSLEIFNIISHPFLNIKDITDTINVAVVSFIMMRIHNNDDIKLRKDFLSRMILDLENYYHNLEQISEMNILSSKSTCL